MTVITQPQQQPQVITKPRRRKTTRRAQQKAQSGSLVLSSLKASLVGGVCILLLMLISLIPLQFLACLVIPGFLVAWLSTGMLAGIFAGDRVKNSYQGGKVGWMAGFWAGIYGGVIAMILAAVGVSVLGIPIVNFGQGIVSQISPDWLVSLESIHITADVIALMGRVFGMFIMVGIIGSLISGLFSSIGGMIYPKLSS
ncbi:MAG: hypothetical protein JXM69_17130 [Anaerolineae bacterium]|nr:hypothetical protein [Anaerolineae bacterium]